MNIELNFFSDHAFIDPSWVYYDVQIDAIKNTKAPQICWTIAI